MEINLYRQNVMLAIRKEMGWPAFKPSNDCIGFCAGRPIDIESGAELARISQMLGKDMIYSSWASSKSREPLAFCVVYRELYTVDIVERLVPFAANGDAPLQLVSIRRDEHFAIDRRGSLVRIEGKPVNIGKGRKLAMKRIRATAATISDKLLAENRNVHTGGEWIRPDAPIEPIVRFG